MTTALPSALEPVEEAGKAELLLHPLRQRILTEAREASTAAEIARRVGLPAQKVNYHVRILVDAGFLKPAGEGRKRNLIGKRYRASARSYLLLPRILGEMSPGARHDADRFSATHLIHLSARLQEELAELLAPDGRSGEPVPTLSLEAELRFETAEQRAAFADALQKAVTHIIGHHTVPAHGGEGTPPRGRPYRLVVGCYPAPERADEDRGPGQTAPEQRRA